MNAAQNLIALLHSQRESSFPFAEGKTLTIRRPAEYELATRKHIDGLDYIVNCISGWDGFTEADFIGAAVGSSDPVLFDRELLRAFLADRVPDIQRLDAAIGEIIQAYASTQQGAAKNSTPSLSESTESKSRKATQTTPKPPSKRASPGKPG